MINTNYCSCFFCVPDITGFTRLISSADVGFSSKVIPALLSNLMDCNSIGLSVAEIEGDAIFFYRTGEPPLMKDVAEQCQAFYHCFAETMNSFKKSDPDNYQKYLADRQLGLKVIIHYGNVMPGLIKGRIKLIGKDVIIVHRLLKNSITPNQYILMTDNYLEAIDDDDLNPVFSTLQINEGSDEYEFIGPISYKFISVG